MGATQSCLPGQSLRSTSLYTFTDTPITECTDASVQIVFAAILTDEGAANNEKDRMHRARTVGYLIVHFYAFRASLGCQPAPQVVSRSSTDSNEAIYQLGICCRERLHVRDL